ncbi:MAG: TetR family transcriptional regulator [Psychromonas sp.]
MSNDIKETKSHKAVRLAIIRIEKGKPKVVDVKRKMSVAAVAEESDLSRALIYRDCDDLVRRINGGVGKGVRQQRDAKQEELKKYKEINKDLRGDIEGLKEMLANIQSKNATLILENKALRVQVGKKGNVTIGNFGK